MSGRGRAGPLPERLSGAGYGCVDNLWTCAPRRMTARGISATFLPARTGKGKPPEIRKRRNRTVGAGAAGKRPPRRGPAGSGNGDGRAADAGRSGRRKARRAEAPEACAHAGRGSLCEVAGRAKGGTSALGPVRHGPGKVTHKRGIAFGQFRVLCFWRRAPPERRKNAGPAEEGKAACSRGGGGSGLFLWKGGKRPGVVSRPGGCACGAPGFPPPSVFPALRHALTGFPRVVFPASGPASAGAGGFSPPGAAGPFMRRSGWRRYVSCMECGRGASGFRLLRP